MSPFSVWIRYFNKCGVDLNHMVFKGCFPFWFLFHSHPLSRSKYVYLIPDTQTHTRAHTSHPPSNDCGRSLNKTGTTLSVCVCVCEHFFFHKRIRIALMSECAMVHQRITVDTSFRKNYRNKTAVCDACGKRRTTTPTTATATTTTM